MNFSETIPTHDDTPPDGGNEATGLPWFHTWRGVYLFVFGSFVLWVALLLALTVVYS